jgi:hypothetical protein
VRVSEALARRERTLALEPDREIAVTEVEPHVDAEIPERLHNVERVAGEAPAALVDQIREPERDQVGVGGHIGVVDLDVIAGVGDHHEVVRAHHVEHPARQLRAAGAAGQHDDGATQGR